MKYSSKNNLSKKRDDFQQRKRIELQQRIKRTRERLGTQAYVAQLLNYGQPSISKMENNASVLPTDTYLKRLARAAKVPYAEEIYWLGLGGYIPWTTMPSLEQIEPVLTVYCEDIQRDWYPVFIMDYRLTVWVMNTACYNIVGRDIATHLLSQGMNFLDIMFNNDTRGNDARSLHDTVTPEDAKKLIQRFEVAFFKFLNLNRRHEPFYELYPEVMESRFGKNSATSREFRTTWDSINIDTENGNATLTEMVRDRLKVTLPGLPLNPRYQNEELVLFHQRVEVIAQMPQFAIVRFQPVKVLQDTLSILTPPDMHEDDYLAIWHDELNRDNQVQELLATYNRDNLMDVSV